MYGGAYAAKLYEYVKVKMLDDQLHAFRVKLGSGRQGVCVHAE